MRSPSTFGKVSLTTPPRLANCGVWAGLQLGQISQAGLGMALWTACGGFDLIGVESLQANPCKPGAVQHEFDDDWTDRGVCCRPIRAQRAAVLDDLHRTVDLRRRAAVALRPDPPDAELGSHLHFQRDRAALCPYLRPLLPADTGDRP